MILRRKDFLVAISNFRLKYRKEDRMEEQLIKDGIELELEELFGAEIVTEELVNYVYNNINEYLLLDSREEVLEFIKDFLVEVDNIRVIW